MTQLTFAVRSEQVNVLVRQCSFLMTRNDAQTSPRKQQDGSRCVVWVYEEKHGGCKFIPFFEEDQGITEAAYQGKTEAAYGGPKKVVELTLGRKKIRVNLDDMIEQVFYPDGRIGPSHKIARLVDLNGTLTVCKKPYDTEPSNQETSIVASHDGGFDVLWFYEETPNNGKWIPFYEEDQLTTERAYVEDEASAEFRTWDNKKIVVDFGGMTQRVFHTEDRHGRQHQVARIADLDKSIATWSKPTCT